MCARYIMSDLEYELRHTTGLYTERFNPDSDGDIAPHDGRATSITSRGCIMACPMVGGVGFISMTSLRFLDLMMRS